MPYNRIFHRCGHTRWVYLSQKKAQRQQRQYWLATQNCADCQRQSQRERRAGQTITDLKEGRQRGLVDLIGSETMNIWAVRIRAHCLAMIDQRFELARKRPEATEEVLHRGLDACIRAMNRHPESAWWIDHQDELPQILVQDYLQELSQRSSCLFNSGNT